jgi:hypothetical protein
MNDREVESINFWHLVLGFGILLLVIKVYLAVWRRSKLAAILMITVGPYLLIGLHQIEKPINYHVFCNLKPDQESCVKWRKTGVIE